MENLKEEKIRENKLDRTRKRAKAALYSCLLIFLFVFFSAKAANAASLYLSPSSGSYLVGKTFSVSVFVSSSDQVMNAAGGVISFPADKIEVTSISKSGSIFSLWVQEPSFSNDAGTINFEGIVMNPGFIGASGKIITINFKTKAEGQATLNFSSGSILANDGAGTNILGSMGSANYQLSAAAVNLATPAEKITEEKPSSAEGVPSAPNVFSSTNPDSSKWYNNKNPQFSWDLTPDITGVSVYLSQSPTSNPGPVSDGLLSSKSYENVEDGVWYFHIKFKNSYGWGQITHFKIQIDKTPPSPFTIEFISGKETENPRPVVVFDTTDSLSGVDYYKIRIGEGNALDLTAEKLTSNLYTLPLQSPGKRNILVQSFDKAGNYTVATDEFNITPLQWPTFTDYPANLANGESLVIQGKSQYPNGKITFWLQKEQDNPQSFTLPINEEGKFTFVSDQKLGDGVYKFWAEVVDVRGARSLPTEKITIVAAKPEIFRLGTYAISFLAVLIPLVALIFVLLFILWQGWHKFSLLRKRLRKEVREAESALHKAFDLLKDDIRKQIKMLEKTRTKRQLTEEEEKIIKQLEKDLDDAEKFVRKEIKDVKKEVR